MISEEIEKENLKFLMIAVADFRGGYILTNGGNGLKLIADELEGYPEIEFRWYEQGGLQFQMQFINRDYLAQQELH